MFSAFPRQNDRIKRIGVLVAATTEHDPESEARVAVSPDTVGIAAGKPIITMLSRQ